MASKAVLATTSSHSSFYNIIPGAIEEGLEIYAVCFDRDWELWSQYPDFLKKINVIRVKDYKDTKATIEAFNSIDKEAVIVLENTNHIEEHAKYLYMLVKLCAEHGYLENAKEEFNKFEDIKDRLGQVKYQEYCNKLTQLF